MEGITKVFGGKPANDAVTLVVESRSIHALAGENGAGKSTLMRILYGMVKPDNGTIAVHGHPLTMNSPSNAMKAGIGMVHQHFMLIPKFTVSENVILGQEPGTRLDLIDMARARDIIRQLSKAFHIDVDPDKRFEQLSVGEQQRVGLLK